MCTAYRTTTTAPPVGSFRVLLKAFVIGVVPSTVHSNQVHYFFSPRALRLIGTLGFCCS